MKKVVINVCFGGFSLSRTGLKRLAELQGRACYFFVPDFANHNLSQYLPSPDESNRSDLFFSAFDIPNPNEVLREDKPWRDCTPEEREARNTLYATHAVSCPDDRTDPLLIQVVEELGEKSFGSCAKLKIVEIPVDVEYVIEEYDGNEHIAETHRTWS